MTRPGPGKFEGNDSEEVSEILYGIVQDGFVDDQVGDVESIGWHGLILVHEGDTETKAQLIEADPANFFADLEACAFVVHEDNNGFFTYEVFETHDAARTVFEEWAKEYDEVNT